MGGDMVPFDDQLRILRSGAAEVIPDADFDLRLQESVETGRPLRIKLGLDPTARRMVWEHLGNLRAQAGTTILFTTHVMEEAERYCERLAILDHGRLVEQGDPRELLERNGSGSLEEVFTAVTGHEIDPEGDEDEGRLSDVRAQRRVARRLG